MHDNSSGYRGKVPIKNFLEDFRSNLTDHQIKEKYGLSARGLVQLIKVLASRNVIAKEDLEKRRQMAVQRDLAKESHFLSGLFLCPFCSHPHPQPFSICPACGMKLDEEVAPPPIGDSGEASYIDDIFNEMAKKDTPVDERSEKKQSSSSPSDDEFPPTELILIEAEETEQEPAPKKSKLDPIKKFFSRFKSSKKNQNE
jgi:hypothetical protein